METLPLSDWTPPETKNTQEINLWGWVEKRSMFLFSAFDPLLWFGSGPMTLNRTSGYIAQLRPDGKVVVGLNPKAIPRVELQLNTIGEEDLHRYIVDLAENTCDCRCYQDHKWCKHLVGLRYWLAYYDYELSKKGYIQWKER